MVGKLLCASYCFKYNFVLLLKVTQLAFGPASGAAGYEDVSTLFCSGRSVCGISTRPLRIWQIKQW